jgi:hypothetical protein
MDPTPAMKQKGGSSTTRLALRLGFLAMALVAMFLLIGAARGTTQVSATRLPGEPTWIDGCSWPGTDTGPYWSFHNACAWHDSCYHYHWSTFMGCNNGFYARMINSCNQTYQWWQWQRPACYVQANVYYTGTILGGLPCYNRWITSCQL